MNVDIELRGLNSMMLFLDTVPENIQAGIGEVVYRSAQQFRDEVISSLAQVTTLDRREIANGVRVTEPKGNAATKIGCHVIIDAAGIPLIDFQYREVRRTTSKRTLSDLEVSVRRDHPVQYRAAFVGSVGLSEPGIYQRGYKGARSAGRLPLHEKFGPSLSDLIREDSGLEERLRWRARTILAINMREAREQWLWDALFEADLHESLATEIRAAVSSVVQSKAFKVTALAAVGGYLVWKRVQWKIDDPVYGVGALEVIP